MSGIGYSQDEVRSIIGSPLFLSWTYIPEHHFSSIEGRTTAPILGIPGGDIAEFVNAIDVFEVKTISQLNWLAYHVLPTLVAEFSGNDSPTTSCGSVYVVPAPVSTADQQTLILHGYRHHQHEAPANKFKYEGP
jgi:hypothetical protein